MSVKVKIGDGIKNMSDNFLKCEIELLTGIGLAIQGNAKENSPYMTGNLRRSISVDFDNVNKGFVVVGSPVVYSRIREYQNRKNPQTRFYLKRGFTEHLMEIDAFITETLDKYFK